MINRIKQWFGKGKYTPAEARELWVKALRSGKYVQGEGCLRNSQRQFCCLGVACDLYSKKVGDLEWKSDCQTHGGYYFADPFYTFGEWLVLPEQVSGWLGLADECGTLHTPLIPGSDDVYKEDEDDGACDIFASLTELNDNAGFTFEQIAKVIESGNLELK